MEQLRKDFESPAKHTSEEAMKKWPEIGSVVKNPRRRFRFTANLEKSYAKEWSATLKKWQDAISRVKDRVRCLRHVLKLKKTYGQFDHQEIRLEKVILATNNFADEKVIYEGEFGKVYKGQMLRFGKLIDICTRRLKCNYGQGAIKFWTEISMLSSLEHKNIIHFVGFCDENNEKIIIYEYAAHGRLDQHLSDPNLTWFQRLQICLVVAHSLSYIHYDVIRCDINSSKIFEPKILFELSTKYTQSWHRLLFSRYFDNTNMTPKYDVYSFGVLLFEVICGRKPIIGNHDIKEEVDDIIDPILRKQMDTQSFSVFTKITFKCLNQQLVQRPTMDQFVKELEDVLELQMKHENLEHSTTANEGTSLNHFKMEWLKIPLSEIRLATNNFDETYSIGFGGVGIVYTCRMINLTWAQRIQIYPDIEHGINYLHTNMAGKPRVIHRDIKSENILLDEHSGAKVADFELSKFHRANQQASTIYTKKYCTYKGLYGPNIWIHLI